jgi:hypothetical protein
MLPLAMKLASSSGARIVKNRLDMILSMLGSVHTISAVNAASSLICCVYSAWQLRSLGFVKTQQAIVGGFAPLATLILAGSSYWRESVISELANMYR